VKVHWTASAVSTVLSIDGSVPDPDFERGLLYADPLAEAGFAGEVTLNVEPVSVPVPGTALLMAMGLGVAGFARRRG